MSSAVTESTIWDAFSFVAIGLRRAAEPALARRNVVHDAGLSGDFDLIPDFQMTRDSELPAHANVVSYFSAAGDADLGAKDAMVAENDVVA